MLLASHGTKGGQLNALTSWQLSDLGFAWRLPIFWGRSPSVESEDPQGRVDSLLQDDIGLLSVPERIVFDARRELSRSGAMIRAKTGASDGTSPKNLEPRIEEDEILPSAVTYNTQLHRELSSWGGAHVVC